MTYKVSGMTALTFVFTVMANDVRDPLPHRAAHAQ